MKVGILTFFRPISIGAVLQACATNRIALQRIGIESELIDYRLPRIEFYRKCFNLKEVLVRTGLKAKLRGIASTVLLFPLKYKRKKHFDKFIAKYLITSKRVYKSLDQLKQECNDYDAYMVGSDLVWNPIMSDGVNPVYFLEFVNGQKKIAYAPSIGSVDINKGDLKEIAKKAEGLDSISLREKTSVEQLQCYVNKNIHTVLDPTLLTYSDDWDDFYSDKPLYKEKYIFAFVLEQSDLLINTVNMLASQYNCPVVTSSEKNSFKAKKVINVKYNLGPSEFLNTIKNAKVVVTNSFHGCAFSVIFHKDFYCIPHTTRGIRMIDMMKSFLIDDRIISNNEKPVSTEIDYQKVETIRKNALKQSMNYLSNALLGNDYE